MAQGVLPKCKFANVVLWNRFLQSFDYTKNPVSLNRAQVTRSTYLTEPHGQARCTLYFKSVTGRHGAVHPHVTDFKYKKKKNSPSPSTGDR